MQNNQSFLLAEILTELWKSTDCLNGTVDAIVDVSLQCEISVFDDTDAR